MAFYNKISVLLVFLINIIQYSNCNSCILIGNLCNQNSCINNVCKECADNTKSIESNCRCQAGEYYNQNDNVCAPCDRNCGTCKNSAVNCTSCIAEDPTGWTLDLQQNICACNERGYVTSSGDISKKPCQRCYVYGKDCVIQCPTGTKPNSAIWRCESEKPEDVANDDKLLIIIVAICVIILQVLLTMCLYNYLYGRLKNVFDKDENKIYPLTDEEQLFLAQQAELQRQKNLQEKEDLRRKQIEEEEYQKRIKQFEEEENMRRLQYEEEEERLRATEAAAALAALQEDEKKRRETDEARRRQLEEEEMARRLAEEERMRLEEEKIRQWELEQELKKKALEAQIALEAAQAEQRRKEEEERLKREAEERERLKLADEERARLAAEEAEQERLKKIAQEVKEKRQRERQMIRQKTMATNEDKIRKMREQREMLKKEKQDMEQFNENLLSSANNINQDFEQIENKRKNALLRKQETILLKQGILAKQATIVEKRKELDEALEGVNYEAAREKVQNMNPDDLIFLQNLKSPPERVKMTLEAVIVTLNNSTKKFSWDDIKKEITNINFRRNIFTYDPENMGQKIQNKLQKEYLSNPDWVLPKIIKAAKAAGILAEWIESLIKFKQMMEKNRPLFEQVKLLEKEEKDMQAEINKLAELDEEEKQLELESSKLNSQEEKLKKQQQNLRRQATLNHDNISEREKAINNLNTLDVSLEQIEEFQSDEDVPTNRELDGITNQIEK